MVHVFDRDERPQRDRLPTKAAGELAPLWGALRDALTRHPTVLFPGRLGSLDGVPFAVWDGDDWRGFLDMAARLQAPLLYVETYVVQPDDDLANHLGELASVSVAFHAGGMLHLWSTKASWEPELDQRDELDLEQRHVQEEARREQIEQIARQLVDVPEFRAASSFEARKDAASRVPAFQEWVRSTERGIDGRPDFARVYDVIAKAGSIIDMEIAPAVWAEVQERYEPLAREFVALPKVQEAATARVRREHAKKFLAESAGVPVKGYQLDEFLGHVKLVLGTSRHRR